MDPDREHTPSEPALPAHPEVHEDRLDAAEILRQGAEQAEVREGDGTCARCGSEKPNTLSWPCSDAREDRWHAYHGEGPYLQIIGSEPASEADLLRARAEETELAAWAENAAHEREEREEAESAFA